jgi:O-antigen/teichoic acid export membrane protein
VVKTYGENQLMTEDSTLLRAARGTGILMFESTITTLIGGFFFVFMARVITHEEMGIYGAVMLVSSIVGIVGRLGLETAASRFIPYFYGNRDYSNVFQTFKHILMISLILALGLGLFFFFISDILSNILFGTPQYFYILQIASVTILLSIIATIFLGFIQGLRNFTILAVAKLLSQIVRISFSVWLLLLGLGVAAIFLGYIFFPLVTILIALPFIVKGLLRIRRFNSLNNSPPLTLKSLLVFSLPMMGYFLANSVSNSIDSFVVLAFLDVKALGIYTVAITASTFVTAIFATPILATLIPSLSEIDGRTGAAKVSSTLTAICRYIALFFLPIALGLAVLSPTAIYVLAGKAYSEAAMLLTILCLGIATYGISVALISALIALGKTVKVMLIFTFSIIVEFFVSIGLIPVLGMPGAALGRSVMYGVMLFLFYRASSEVLAASLDWKTMGKGLFSSLIMASALYPVALFTDFHIIFLPFYLIFALIIYILALSVMKVLNLQDVQFICKLIPGGKYMFSKIEAALKGSGIASKIIRKILNMDSAYSVKTSD